MQNILEPETKLPQIAYLSDNYKMLKKKKEKSKKVSRPVGAFAFK